jgi:hypothetical protein
LRERAPVEETIVSSSISMPGKGVTSDPEQYGNVSVQVSHLFCTNVSLLSLRNPDPESAGPNLFEMLNLDPYLNPYQQSPETVRTTKSLTLKKKLAPVAIMMFFVLTTSFTEPSGFSTDTCNTVVVTKKMDRPMIPSEQQPFLMLTIITDGLRTKFSQLKLGRTHTYANCFGYIFVIAPI